MTLCEYCKVKKTPLIPFTCKCKYSILCILCRHAEKHECMFDYKTHGKQILIKNNPIIVNSKIDAI